MDREHGPPALELLNPRLALKIVGSPAVREQRTASHLHLRPAEGDGDPVSPMILFGGGFSSVLGTGQELDSCSVRLLYSEPLSTLAIDSFHHF